MNLHPKKWLKSSQLPIVNDIVLFIFNDSNYAKESIVWKLGRVSRVETTKMSALYSMKENRVSKH